MSRYKLAIFDLDGTLLDTGKGVLDAVAYTIGQCNKPRPTDEELRTFIGPPIQDSFQRQYGLSKEEADAMAAVFRDAYKDRFLLEAVPYEGIYDCLKELRKMGILVSVATYKRQDYTDKILEHFGFTEHFDYIHGSDFEGKLRKKDIIELCIASAGITDYNQALMIGDTYHDATGAEAVGVPFLGVTYGYDFRSAEEVAKYPSVGSAATPMGIVEHFA